LSILARPFLADIVAYLIYNKALNLAQVEEVVNEEAANKKDTNNAQCH